MSANCLLARSLLAAALEKILPSHRILVREDAVFHPRLHLTLTLTGQIRLP